MASYSFSPSYIKISAPWLVSLFFTQESVELETGYSLTVEPSLYGQRVGGVRIEDLLVVTEDGYENLTEYLRELHIV